MRVCYVDEAGCPGTLPSATSDVQPVLVVAAFSLPIPALKQLTVDYLHLKHRFFPALRAAHFLDLVLAEVKGSDLRRDAARHGRRQWRPPIQFLGAVMRLLDEVDASVFGRVWVKEPGTPIDPTAIYTYSIQAICETFETQLAAAGQRGFVIADSRRKQQNAMVAHSIFTQKFRSGGDPFEHIVEMPTFGHSDNHVGLQIADLIASAVIFPLAVQSYCKGHIEGVHTRRDYKRLKLRFADPIRKLQYRYRRSDGRWAGGITVSDPLGCRTGAELFR